jgi:hypothetical protein
MVTDSDFVYNLCRMGELNIFISTFFKLNRKTKHQQLGILLSVGFREKQAIFIDFTNDEYAIKNHYAIHRLLANLNSIFCSLRH